MSYECLFLDLISWEYENAERNGVLKKVSVEYKTVPLSSLETAQVVIPQALSLWQEALRRRRTIPALVVNSKVEGGYYVQDGRHRVFVLGHYGIQAVRVADLIPLNGYQWKRLEENGEYRLVGTDESAN